MANIFKHRASTIEETSEKQFISEELKNKILTSDSLTNFYTKPETDALIDEVKKLTTGVSFIVSKAQWEGSNFDFSHQLNHNLDISIEAYSVSFYVEHSVCILDYTFIDNNSIIIYSDEAIDVTVVIKQSVEASVVVPQEVLDSIQSNTDEITLLKAKPEVDVNLLATKEELTAESVLIKEYADTAVERLLDRAPDALNTLNELSAALGDDANFAATVAAQMSEKAEAIHAHDTYVTKVEGKELSTNDLTDELKAKIETSTGFQKDWGGFENGTEVKLRRMTNSNLQVGEYAYAGSCIVNARYESTYTEIRSTVEITGFGTNQVSSNTYVAFVEFKSAGAKISINNGEQISVPHSSHTLLSQTTARPSVSNEKVGLLADLLYRGSSGELIVNTDTNELHLMDGIEVGGHKIGGANPFVKDWGTLKEVELFTKSEPLVITSYHPPMLRPYYDIVNDKLYISCNEQLIIKNLKTLEETKFKGPSNATGGGFLLNDGEYMYSIGPTGGQGSVQRKLLTALESLDVWEEVCDGIMTYPSNSSSIKDGIMYIVESFKVSQLDLTTKVLTKFVDLPTKNPGLEGLIINQDGACSGLIGDYIYITGNMRNEKYFRKVNLKTKVVETFSLDLEEGFSSSASFILNNEFYICGGITKAGPISSKLYKFNPTLNQVILIDENFTSNGRYNTKPCFHNDSMYIGGGTISHLSLDHFKVALMKSTVNNDVINVSLTKGTRSAIKQSSGIHGQLLINSTDNCLHVMDGSTKGGHEVAMKSSTYTKEEVDTLLAAITTPVNLLIKENDKLRKTIKSLSK